MTRPNAEQLIELLGLEPLPVEGGLFRQTWRSPALMPISMPTSMPTSTPAAGQPRPLGTATLAMLTDAADSFSAMHRLPGDEIWHFYLGDPIRILLLHPDGSTERLMLGQDVLGGQRVQAIIPAGVWMGARLLSGGRYGLFGNTLAPGFMEADYEGGDSDLARQYPDAAGAILDLLRPGAAQRMPDR